MITMKIETFSGKKKKKKKNRKKCLFFFLGLVVWELISNMVVVNTN